MKIKKRFKLIDDEKEEAFLNELSKQGYLLKEYDGEHYHFVQTSQLHYYLIEYFNKALSKKAINDYHIKGYKLQNIYKSKVEGYYYFFTSKNEIVATDRRLLDRYQLLLNSKKRVDRFSAVIFVASFLLFSYFYFKTYNLVYIFILLLIVLLGGFFGHVYLETIKRLSYYAGILSENEGQE